MNQDLLHPDVDEFVERYESALANHADVDFSEFLPTSSHPAYDNIVVEMLRVDMEHRWSLNRRTVDDYVRQFPHLLRRKEPLERLAFEEFRLKGRFDEPASPDEYRQRYGIATSHWRASGTQKSPQRFVTANSSDATHANVCESTLRWMQRADTIPDAVHEFHGFELREEIGRGAFSRVYLAHQRDLAQREVVLKVTGYCPFEAEQLARLQHTNIVPIYSLHHTQDVHAICMPYRGHRTLAQVMDRVTGELPATGAVFGESLATVPYVDACLRLMRQLAEALAHAHQKGVLHCDLKPANILLADDDTPMLLDFNLSQQTGADGVANALLGGTLAYMPAEQLQALNGRGRIDARTDLFALGAIFTELLTGRPLFPRRTGPWSVTQVQMLEDRLSVDPQIRQIRPQLPHSVAAILTRCVAPLPEGRYRSASELVEDLTRHAEHRPLLHAPDRDPFERFTKWTRRHPAIKSVTAICLGFACLLTAGGAVVWHQSHQIASQRAEETLREFDQSLQTLRADLAIPTLDQSRLTVQMQAQALYEGHGGDRPDLASSIPYHHLKPDSQRAWRDGLAELAYLLNQVALTSSPPAELNWEALLARCERAIAWYGADPSCPAALHWQRAELLDRLGRSAEAEHDREHQAKASSYDDRFLGAVHWMTQQKWQTALSQLQAMRNVYPTDYAAWFLMGNCNAALDEIPQAVACFDVCIGLNPKYHQAWFHRGLAHLQVQDFAAALHDFDRVLELQPDSVEARANRALARRAVDDLPGAEADLTAALQHNHAPTRLYFQRASLRAALGKGAEAQADFQQALSREPEDEASYVARGMARLPQDPAGALADFGQALHLNPRSRPALRNIAHVDAERLGRPAQAIENLEKVVSLYPRDAESWSGLAVLHARQGSNEMALRCATEALSVGTDPKTKYQVACAYALLSGADPSLQSQALSLLAAAFRGDVRWIHAAPEDPDLKTIHNDSDFRDLLRSAQVLHQGKELPGVVSP